MKRCQTILSGVMTIAWVGVPAHAQPATPAEAAPAPAPGDAPTSATATAPGTAPTAATSATTGVAPAPATNAAVPTASQPTSVPPWMSVPAGATPGGPGLVPSDRSQPKDPRTAFQLSLWGTLVPLALIGGGIALDNGEGAALTLAGWLGGLATPSLGHWYAGNWWTVGTGFRIGATGLAVLGGLSAVGEVLESEHSGEPVDNSGSNLLLGIAVAAYVGGAVLDVATAGEAAREYNEEHHLTLAPMVIGSSSTQSLGLGLSGSF